MIKRQRNRIIIIGILIAMVLGNSVESSSAKSRKNLMKNPGFETANFSMWKYKGSGMDTLDYYTEDPVGIWGKKEDCHSGDYTFHFWSTYNHHFRLEQTVSKRKLSKKKTYKASVYIQGDEIGKDAEITYMLLRMERSIFLNWLNLMDGKIGKSLQLIILKAKRGMSKLVYM